VLAMNGFDAVAMSGLARRKTPMTGS